MSKQNGKRKSLRKATASVKRRLPSPSSRLSAGSEGERSEPQRTADNRDAAVPAGGGGAAGVVTGDCEVVAKPKRRTFTAEYKLAVIAAADACTEPGQIGELLRREGLYSSHLSMWRQQLADGQLQAMQVKRGRKPASEAAKLAKVNEQLRRQLATRDDELRKAHLIIAAQKKVAALLELIDAEADAKRD